MHAQTRPHEPRVRPAELHRAYQSVRHHTLALCASLAPEDMVVQSMPDASPSKWHLAHTSWFFERFVLGEALHGYAPCHPQYDHLFNSYYDAVGPRHPRAERGVLTRPTVDEIVTLASIVEEEARVAEERPVIAGVYWNRLRQGMKLEADPTVQYALGSHRQRVLYRDLEVDSPYNTYLYAGLPPGPIASPGRASLEATLYPDSVPWLYFFATGEGGRHTFSATFAEHNRKRRELNR